MELDAETFAKWDVDYIKVDGCYADYRTYDVGYPEFGRLLNKTGRPMVYSCSWPVYQELKGLMVIMLSHLWIHLSETNIRFDKTVCT